MDMAKSLDRSPESVYQDMLGIPDQVMDMLLLGCCTRFLYTVIKWCSQRYKGGGGLMQPSRNQWANGT